MKRFLIALSIPLSLMFALPAFANDGTQPLIGPPSPSNATVGIPITISADAVDADSGISTCNLWMDNLDAGPMTVSNGVASKLFTFMQAGIHDDFVFCRDNSGSIQSGPYNSVTVAAGSGGAAPNVGEISPTTVVKGTTVVLSVPVSATASLVAGCELIVDSFDRGAMNISGGIATKQYVFTSVGTAAAYAQCFDGNGNSASGPATIITVSPPSSSPGSPGGPSPNPPPATQTGQPTARLIKTACMSGALAGDPCHAVYYQGTDGKRHSFPNQKIFLTWYSDFSSVQEISAQGLSAIPLGSNVTYRPGAKLVKFTTLNHVYAVAKGSVLRWVTTESVAQSLYGADWNKKIDDISDTYFGDYTFGIDITSPQGYSAAIESANTVNISDNK